MVVWQVALGVSLILWGVFALLPVAIPAVVWAVVAIVVGLLVVVGR